MNVLIPGGSGFLGQAVAKWFKNCGDNIVALTRSPNQNRATGEVLWDGKSLGA